MSPDSPPGRPPAFAPVILLGAFYFFLIRPTAKSNTTAPTIAVTSAPAHSPPTEMPKTPNNQPPRTAPMIPTMMFPRMPNPPPFMIRPANHPATPPISKNTTSCCKFICSSFRSLVSPNDPRLPAASRLDKSEVGSPGELIEIWRFAISRRSVKLAGGNQIHL